MRQPAVTIRSDVAAELAYAASFRADAYQACVLLGAVTSDGIDVAGYTDLAVLDGPFEFLRDLVDDWAPMTRRLNRDEAALSVLGWASFRPDSAGSLSSAEQVVHRTFFNLPYQITLTVDAATATMAAYCPDADGRLVVVPLMAPERPSDGVPA